jgi:cytochrome P450
MIAPPLDPIAAATHPDPYPYYARLAAEPRLLYDAGLKLWVGASAECVEAVFNHGAARVRPPGEPVPPALAGSATGTLFARFARANDGPRHAELRAAVESAIERLSHDAPAAAGAGAGAETLDGFVDRFPIDVLAAALGFPAERLPDAFDWIRAFARAIAPNAGEREIAAGEAASEALLDAFARYSPADAASGVAILFQSYDSTRGAIGNALVALGRDAGLRREARANPNVARAVVEYALRYDPSVQNTRRSFARDAEVAGAGVRAGETVLLLLAAAQRDERCARLYAFGFGAHACPGRALAVEIAAAAVRALLVRGMDLETLEPAGYEPFPNLRVPRFAN